MAQINLKVVLDKASASKEIKDLKKDLSSLNKGMPNIDTLRKKYANLLNTIKGTEKNYAKGTFSKIAEDALANLEALKKLDPQSKAYAKTVKHLDSELERLSADFAETRQGATNFHGSLKEIIVGFGKFQLAAMLVMKPLQLIRDGFDSLNETLEETEKRVIALQRVAGDAANAGELYDLAQRYGQSFENVSDVVERFAKSGYTWAESIQAAEAALIAMNVAELDAEQSSEGLIAVMKQYGFEIDHLNHIIGVLNKTSDTAAVTTEELLIALQKTGSTAKNANITFEETVGLITALSEGTAASGQNIGNALRSLIVFTSDSKALDKFAGLSSGMAETVKNFRSGRASILDVWQGLGGELAGMGSQRGTLEDLFGGAELSADIEAQLTQITDSFAEIYGTAGNYRQNYFIALLNNIKEVTDVTENLGDVTSYSQKENEKYLSTYEAKVTSLTAKWQELANDEQGWLAFKKGLVEVASGLLDAVEAAGGIGGVLSTVIAIASPFLIKWTVVFGAQAISAAKTGIVSLFTAIKTGAISANAALGIIGVALGAIALTVNSISAAQEKVHEKNQKLIDDWESIKNQTAELHELYEEYKKLSPEVEGYAEIEENLVKAIGEKSVALEDLTKNTDEYREAVKKLAEEELRAAEQKFTLAKNAAAEELEGFTFSPFAKQYSNFSGDADKAANVLRNIGVGFDFTPVFGGGRKISLETRNSGNVEDQLYNYDLYVSTAEKVWNEYKKAILSGDEEYSNEVLDVYESLVSQIEAAKPYVENYRNTSDTLDYILENLSDIKNDSSEIDSNVQTTSKNLQNLDKTTLTNIVNKIKEVRDATKDSYEYEKKKKAVLEAEKALEEAQKNRLVKTYNEALGDWEYVTNQKEIEKAKDRLEEARKDVEEAALKDIEKLLENDMVTNKDLDALLEKWATAYGEGDFSKFTDLVKEILKEFGIYLDAGKNTIGAPNDKVQAVTKDGDVAGNLLLSNAKKFSMPDRSGLLFDVGTDRFGVNQNQLTSNRSTVDSHNVSYTVNGVPIPQSMAENRYLRDIFEAVALV